ncbi:hypothetical protein BJX64DRAFT_265506 [Aspergillus heterothallicus]
MAATRSILPLNQTGFVHRTLSVRTRADAQVARWQIISDQLGQLEYDDQDTAPRELAQRQLFVLCISQEECLTFCAFRICARKTSTTRKRLSQRG